MKNKGLSVILVILGVIALVYGLQRGEAGQVLMKAILICLECIGLG